MPLKEIGFNMKIFIVLFPIVTNVLVRCEKDCWISFDAKKHYAEMDELDDRYAKARENYQETVGGSKFDDNMFVALVKNRGMAERAIHAAKGDRNRIPAGINLGGYCMMKMPKTMLFFHRMKLRNETKFRITDIKNDLANLTLRARLHLNDLFLFGSYDTMSTAKSDRLVYEPTFGQVELLLTNVKYKVEGRYRLLKNRLNIELIISELNMDNIIMMYRNKESSLGVKLKQSNIDVFVDRLKIDLDKWLKDYFNDYLMYFVVAEDENFLKYNQEKTKMLNHFADNAIDTIIKKINETNINAVQIPTFSLFKSNEKEVKLRNGVLRGLNSIYRRGIATGNIKRSVRNVDAVVGFSNLKLMYKYDAILKSGLPPVTGNLILTADELTAHMSLSLVKEMDTADLSFKFMEQARAESLTVEGPANRMISNFKYLLERHIIALMSNSLVHTVSLLGTLDKCVQNSLKPFKEGEEEEKEVVLDSNIDEGMSVNISNIVTDTILDNNMADGNAADGNAADGNAADGNLPDGNLPEDDMGIDLSKLIENDGLNKNVTKEKILIGDNASRDDENLSKFQYYHRRIPLKNYPRKIQQKRLKNKTIKKV